MGLITYPQAKITRKGGWVKIRFLEPVEDSMAVDDMEIMSEIIWLGLELPASLRWKLS